MSVFNMQYILLPSSTIYKLPISNFQTIEQDDTINENLWNLFCINVWFGFLSFFTLRPNLNIVLYFSIINIILQICFFLHETPVNIFIYIDIKYLKLKQFFCFFLLLFLLFQNIFLTKSAQDLNHLQNADINPQFKALIAEPAAFMGQT